MVSSSSMSSYILRDYQERDIGRVRAEFKRGARRVIYVAPTGSGKTILFTELTRRVLAKARHVLILCHRYELIEQISAALSPQPHWVLMGRGHGFAVDFVRDSPWALVASVQTLVRREIMAPDFIIIDEAHHLSRGNSWAKILARYPSARYLGVTATPCRLDGRPLSDHFDAMVIGPTYQELEHAGYLTGLRAWSPPTINCRGMRVRGGDFNREETIVRSDSPSVTGDAINHYQRLGLGRRAIIFDVSIDSARRRAGLFRQAGFTAEAIDGTQTHSERSGAVARFRAGTTQVLVSVDLVSEGFDLPAIEVGISLRPTASLALWMQQAGRILRPLEGKSVAILLDHAGNLLRHGFPNEQRDWSLVSAVTTRDRRKPLASLRLCPQCFFYNSPGADVCEECGAELPVKNRSVAEVDGELKETTAEEIRLQRLSTTRFRSMRRGARTYEELVRVGRLRGMRYPEGWAKHVLNARSK